MDENKIVLHQAKIPKRLATWLRAYKEMLRGKGDESSTANKVTQLAFEEFIKNHHNELREYYEQQAEIFGTPKYLKRGGSNG